MAFDPNSSASEDSGVFGLPFSAEESKLVIIPVPWEATVSYGGGTSLGPELVLRASKQVDLFDLEVQNAYEVGYFMEEISGEILSMSDQAKAHDDVTQVNALGAKLNDWVYSRTKDWLGKNKIVALLGGDHSTPYGAIRAISEKYKGDIGILHIDAHADLREAYEGFTWSHASIMFNVMKSSFKPKKLVQVGIRDFCEDEFQFINSRSDIKTFFDTDLQKQLLSGTNWQTLADEIIDQLPEKVYVSFDVDGLDPNLCPNTGTPVPGGLSYHQALSLFRTLHERNKQIVGFDLNEVSGGPEQVEWNGNIGARLLYKLCGWTAVTNSLYKLK
jgi:agmatinase